MMANLQFTHASILNSNAQVMILPVNNAGMLLDPVLMRTKTLYPDNYQRYYRACRNGELEVGTCLLHKRARELAGLSVSHNGNQPSYIANLVISDHPYHPTRKRWLNAALLDLQQQLSPLIRYQGIRKISLLTRPLISMTDMITDTVPNRDNGVNIVSTSLLDWETDTLPLLTQHLQALPKVRIELHLPKMMLL